MSGRRGGSSAGPLGPLLVVAVLALVAWAVLRAAYQWLTGHEYVIVIAVVVIAAVTARLIWRARQDARERARRLAMLRYDLSQIDAMSPTAFEIACRELLRRDGLRAEHVGRSNDQCADVTARDPANRIWVVQCKHTRVGKNVGVQVLQAVNGTARQVHHADLVIVATNGGFTGPARTFAASQHIYLIGRHGLARWATQGHSLYTVLGLAPAASPARRSPAAPVTPAWWTPPGPGPAGRDLPDGGGEPWDGAA
jgi:restriction system protein